METWLHLTPKSAARGRFEVCGYTDLASWCFLVFFAGTCNLSCGCKRTERRLVVAEVTVIMIRVSEIQYLCSFFFFFFSETCDTNRFVASGNYAHFAGSLWRIFQSVIQVIRHITCAERLVHRWICLPLYRFHPARLGIYATRCMAVVPQPCGDAHGCREDWADIIITEQSWPESARLGFRWFGVHPLYNSLINMSMYNSL